MTKSDRLREQIDACRRGADDLSLPELNELTVAVRNDREVAEELSRAHAFDRKICQALHDAPVPPGLADRLIASMQAEATPTMALTDRTGPNEGVTAGRPRFSRRQWWLAGGAAALAASIVAIAVPLMRPEREVAQEELSSDVAGWMSNLDANKWQPAATVALPKGVELDSAVNGKALQWQSFQVRGNKGWTGTVTAIDLRPAGQPQAVLFVVRSSARFDVPSTPAAARRLALSRGFKATAWQRRERGVLLVLVVEEVRGQLLEDFLRKHTEA